MAEIPDVTYGYATVRIVTNTGDGPDGDDKPDPVIPQGRVVITPDADEILIQPTDGSPSYLWDPKGFQVDLITDPDGTPNAYARFRLVATDNPIFNPVDWTYTISFVFTDDSGTSIRPFSFSVPTDGDIDLAQIAPVIASNGQAIVRGPAGPAPTFEVGTVSTGAPGSAATLTLTPDPDLDNAYIVDASLPRGADGTTIGADLDAGYLETTGVNGDYASSPAICSITGDIDVRWKGLDLNPASTGAYRAIVNIAGALDFRQQSSNGKLQVVVNNGAATNNGNIGAATIPDADGYRCTWRASDGQLKIFALDPAGAIGTINGDKWTQVGTTVLAPVTGNQLTAGAKAVGVGGTATNGSEANKLKTQSVQIFDGIDGTLAVDVEFSGRNNLDKTFLDGTGHTWTIYGHAATVPVSGSLIVDDLTITVATQSDILQYVGGWGSKRVNPITGKFHPYNFGPVDVDPALWTVVQQATAIRDANEAARVASSLPNATGSTLYFDRAYTINADTSLLDPLSRLPYCALKYWDNVTYEGSGLGSVLTLDAQANCHVFGHPGRLQSDGSQDQIFNVSIKNLVIDGNMANQDGTHMHDGYHFTMCPGLNYFNAQARNCDGNGYYSSAVGEHGAGAGTVTTSPMVWTTGTAPATITVGSTAPFPAAGQLVVFDGTGNQRSVTYTGLTGGTTFTGVTLVGTTGVAGTVPVGSLVMVDPGAHIVMPMTVTSPRFTGNARWGMMCGATNRHVTYTDIHADGNGTLQALIAGRMPCQTIVANGHVDLVVDDGTSIAVNLLAGDTAASVATKITAGLASMSKAVAVTFAAADDSVTFASPHKLGLGTPVVFSALAGGVTGIAAGTTYYVHKVLSATAVTLTLTVGGLGFGSTIDITHDGTGTGTYGAPTASLTASGILKIASGIWGGTSRVYLQTSSTTNILINLGLTIAPILIAENSFRAGAQEYGGVRYDQSESVSSGTWVDQNVGDGVYIHNVNQRADVGIHSTRNGGIGIYVDAWDHSTGVAWDSSMNCTDFGYASYRVDGFGSANTAELYFDNGVEGYGLTHDSTLYGFVGPGEKSTIGGKPDNRVAAWAVFVADNHTLTVGFDQPNPNSLHITKINAGDGGLTGVLRPPTGYKPTAVTPLTPVTKTANYTAVRGDMILADTTGGTFTITIPAASAGIGQIGVKWIKGAVAPTIALSGTDHFNTSTGGTSATPVLLNQGYLLISDASAVWIIGADDLPFSALQTQLDARYLAIGATLDTIAAPVADRSMGSHKITGMANGTADTDAQAFGQRPFDAGRLTAPVTITNVSGAQVLWAATTIPAAKLAVGATFFYTVTGTLDEIATSGAFTFLTKINGSTANSSAMPSQTGAASGVFWSLVVYVTVIATGVGGSVNVTGFLTLPTAAAGTQGQKIIGNVQAVDLSAGLTIRADVNMATANAGNTVRAQAGACAQTSMP